MIQDEPPLRARLIDSIDEAVITTDPTGKVLYWSKQAAEMYGWAPEEVLGRQVAELTVPTESREDAERIMDLLRAGQGWKGIFEVTRRDGTRFPAEVSLTPVRDESGQLVAITGRTRPAAREDLAEAVLKMNAELLALIAHEVRNPLTAIIGNAVILRSRARTLEPDVLEEVSGDLLRESQRLHETFENLLALAKEESSGAESGPVALHSVTEKVIVDHNRRQPNRKINLSSAENVLAEGNPSYVDLVLRNLLSNAEKYSPPDQPIDIDLTTKGDEAIMSVSDRGPGIPPEDRDRIFSSFFRSPTHRGMASGLGLGLTVSKRLVELQGGLISVKERPGGGSTFVVSLPASRAIQC
jgi:PAS domain S-box-containing protein